MSYPPPFGDCCLACVLDEDEGLQPPTAYIGDAAVLHSTGTRGRFRLHHVPHGPGVRKAERKHGHHKARTAVRRALRTLHAGRAPRPTTRWDLD